MGAAVIGFFFILSPGMLVSLVGTIVCVFLLVTGMSNIQAAMARRAWGDRAWWVPLAVGIVCVLLGLYALFAPGEMCIRDRDKLDPLFLAAAEAAEESVLNALAAAVPMVGYDGTVCHALSEFADLLG